MGATPYKLQKGEQGCFVVLSIVENVKNFNTAHGHRYRHDITFVNEKKEMVAGEYLTAEPQQSVFVVNQRACIEGMEHGVITPVGNPEEWENLGDNALMSSDVSGKNFVFALQGAVAVNQARINIGQVIETGDILRDADLFFDWMVSKHKRTINIHK